MISRSRDGPVPVVELTSGSYKHKEYGKIFTPEINVVSWASMDGVEAPPAVAKVEDQSEDPEPEQPKEEKPRRRRRRAS